MQDQNTVDLERRVAALEANQVSVNMSPSTVKQMLQYTKGQYIITTTPPTFDAPQGSIAIKATPTKQLWVKSTTGWIQIV